MVRAVVFDLYETLITEHETNKSPKPDLARRLGVDISAVMHEWDKRRGPSLLGEIPDYRSLLREICIAVGRDIDEELLVHLESERIALKALPFQSIECEVLDVIQTLKNQNILIGLISNARREEVAAWPACRLAQHVDATVFSCDVGLLKPGVEIYHEGCQRLGVNPGECLFVGDGANDELSGAHGAGMKPYWASWYLERWPHWNLENALKERSGGFPRLTTMSDLIDGVEGLPRRVTKT